MLVERALPFDHQLSCTIIDYHQLSFSLSLFKFFMIVDDSFSRLTTRMIVHDGFSVFCFGNHWSHSGQKTCCCPLSSRKIHTFTSVCLTGHHLVVTFLRGKSFVLIAHYKWKGFICTNIYCPGQQGNINAGYLHRYCPCIYN